MYVLNMYVLSTYTYINVRTHHVCVESICTCICIEYIYMTLRVYIVSYTYDTRPIQYVYTDSIYICTQYIYVFIHQCTDLICIRTQHIHIESIHWCINTHMCWVYIHIESVYTYVSICGCVCTEAHPEFICIQYICICTEDVPLYLYIHRDSMYMYWGTISIHIHAHV